MIQSNMAPQGMVVTPHHLASESALAVLRDGGSALEAMVAAAATIAVVYPHMNGLGGDGFWLVVPPEGEPVAIDASGAAGSLATMSFYQGRQTIPHRGPEAALTVAGTVSGWQEALTLSQELGHAPLPPHRLLRDAIRYAADGIPVTASQAAATAAKAPELQHQPGFAATFMPDGGPPQPGSRFTQPALAATLSQLSEEGLESFYRGRLARSLADDMHALGMPVTLNDLQQHRARRCTPLHLAHSEGDIWNMTPPTQGLVSLAILGITDRLDMAQADEAQTLHRIVEATKQAFSLRDRHITDPRHSDTDVQALLSADHLASLATNIDDHRAAPWGTGRGPGDTVWMGAIDSSGLAVSFIQSIYHEFGSGVVLPGSGITWQNRGAAFSLQPDHLLALLPGKQPFHTLNPAAARLKDGRVMVYGSMGGDGQPQTQAAIFTRHVIQGMPLQQAVSAPRWLLGRTWGEASDSLKLEARVAPETVGRLRLLGHQVELLSDFSEVVGHAGAVVRHTSGMLEGAFDPRSNGSAAGF
ncbi:MULTISPECIES: gamma-glutamyltransferase family protein [Pantoea]|uniref:Gamma-glutamyltransferase family protein n=1 Tax=Pantoea eucrina TaxID=472693 RepID=A0ABS1Z9Q3_9GAMM|nr:MULTISPECIES: gamma-glutamyltransferase family protein [Pantoea]AIX52142.1 gamma-glutamyltransferase [Pantoea sp. PSNIH1]PPS59133.1 gamma-glutamyltransferase family protein [Pantoea sp. BRM17]MBM0749160.1 gamma-glutamyltransferase family protein [Pantoea eucrina]MDJ0024591.1 gamma-glutamyltransferase family protein [Pantoea eucrina]NIE69278.1 gamma-glutamyltransferase family protein [Pantoea sp. Acro-807]